MASGLTLDSGALIAAEKGTARFRAIWKEAVERSAVVTVPADVISQVWRGNSPAIARILNACEIEILDEPRAKRIGALLAKSKTSDVIDAAVVLGASDRGDAIVTSDPDDVQRLLAATGIKLSVLSL
jgi:predicted nucleic acid-binding protein